MSEAIREAVRLAGVVGAGGAGFPTHIKLNTEVDTVIANGAECEPLLACDKAVMEHFAEKVIRGLNLVREAVSAERAVVALKGKEPGVVDALRKVAEKASVEVFLLDNVYPAGDEQVLVYEVTRRIVPESGLPLDVGCVVDNVITLTNIADAVDDQKPVTERMITIHGEVFRPVTVSLPIGTSFSRALEIADGAKLDDFVVVEGGPIMGGVVTDMSQPIKKTTSGLIVLAPNHPLVERKLASMRRESLIGRSVCCQCRMCTDLCPRYLLGHEIHPHLVMRTMMHAAYVEAPPSQMTNAYLCCDCGICEIIACPLALSPRKVNMSLKQELAQAKIANTHHRSELSVHDSRNVRLVPMSRLVARTHLTRYMSEKSVYDPVSYDISSVRLPLSQHIGLPSSPVVAPGDPVESGDLLAEIPERKLGARIHASISGKVISVTQEEIILESGGV